MVKQSDNEVLTTENPNRFVIFPIKYHDVWQFYKESVSNFWSVEEINIEPDIKDWQKLNETECHFFSVILAYLANGEQGIGKNIIQNFSNEIEIPEIRAFFGIQIAMENMHTEMYSLLLNTYITDDIERKKLFDTIESFQYFKKKDAWVQDLVISQELSIGHRLVAYSIKKTIFFSGIFAAIKWMKKKGILSGLITSNDMIFRDNSLYTDFIVLLTNYISNKPDQHWVHKIVQEAVAIEHEFINVTLPVVFIGMDCKIASVYLKSCADYILNDLGYEKIFKVENPFGFIERNKFRVNGQKDKVEAKSANTFSVEDDF